MVRHALALPRRLGESNLREILTRPDRIAVGYCRRNPMPHELEFLVDSLSMRVEMPRGSDLPPYCDWVVIARPTGAPGVDLNAWVQRLEPRENQTLIVALVGLGANGEGWDGVVVSGSSRHALDAVRIPGPGMLRFERAPAVEFEVEERFSRTAGALGDPVYQLLRSQSVLLLGAGRTGSAAAYQLSALGVRKLTISDADCLGNENLDGMYAVQESDVGRPKALVLQERLLQFRSDMVIAVITDPPGSGAVIEAARGCDLIITCSDRDSGKLAGSLLAARFLKAHLDVGVEIQVDADGKRQLAADVRLLLPSEGCVECVGGLAQPAAARQELFSGVVAPQVDWRAQRAGSLITLNALAVSTGIHLWLDLLAGDLRHSTWHRLLWQPGDGLRIDAASVSGASDCSVCGPRKAP